MGRFLDFVFNRFFLGMIATAFFWLLTLAGGIILGLAPASATLMSLYAEHGYSFREYSLKEAWSLYKQNFVSSNLIFYSFLGVGLVLTYGLYLLVQLPHQTIVHLIATLLNVLVVALIFLAYTVSLKLQVYFALSYRNSLKLSLIGIFMSLAAVAKVLLGTVLLVAIGYYMPALLFFVGIGMWHFFISDMLEPVYEIIHEKLATKRMKQFWLHTLLRTYSSVMIIIIASFAILLSYADWDSREKEAQRVAQRVTARTVSEIEYYHRESTQIAQALVENQARIEGIYKYFSLSMPDYFYWQLERKASPYISVSLYENVDDLYVRNDFVTGVAIAFQDYKEVYVSTKDKRSGEKIRAEDFKPAGNSFAIPVSDPVSDQDLGVIYISLDPAVLYHAIDNTRGHTPMAVTVTSPFDTEIFHMGETVDKESENWLVGLTSHGYQVQVAVPKNFVLQGTVTSSALIVGLSLLFIVILYLTLRQTFANYQKQVVDLVDSIQAIAQGQEGLRIDTLEKDQELLLIAETTNDMLDRLEKNIHDIYQLELSQKDANMRALQAQINPHFMYNTLEFLRMYAVMQSQDELADIIYEFSSLLRNNISDERETLLKQELEFCRKYSYLCMVRYPKSIAYGFKIDPELENMKIPKFTLQPLVENYFAHGVDHRRTDNVISIKALKQDGFVEILVVDNGRGMSAEKLANIREKLSQKYFEHQASYSDQRQSIGIVNVHERFVLYFGDRYAITIESAEQAGVQYRITIQDE